MSQGAEAPVQTSFRVGRVKVKYYVREPSPDHWNAVGVVYRDDSDLACVDRCPMVVGLGSTYYEAVGDLMARMLGGPHSDLESAAATEEIALTS